MKNIFLGLDSSTQSMSAVLLEEEVSVDKGASSKILYENSVNFDQEFPQYGTKNGVLENSSDPHVQCTPPQLWVEALEAIFAKMKNDGVEMGSIRCIGVSGQQHGSVYFNDSMLAKISSLKANKSLAEQLAGGYSRDLSPIWMDSSTTEECREIAESLGGNPNVGKLTGSYCFERFTGPQIRKFYKQNPQAYAQTAVICLVSNFIPTILAGKHISIDPGDGAGMNLMSIADKKWDQAALEATAPNLREKLGEIVPSDLISGSLSPYFVEKYGMNPDCKIIPGTGDNPSSLIGLGLVSPGSIGISLGTSDTLFAFMTNPNTDPKGESHVFGSPADNYMVLSCYKNGSLAREKIREEFGLDWEAFSQYLEQGEPGNGGKVMLPYYDTEIIPRIPTAGVQKFGLENSGPGEHIQALIEAQMTSMALHSEWLGETPQKIYVTGGASANRAILQVMANVFNAEVLQQATTNAAGTGAALRAHQAWRKSNGLRFDWEMIVGAHVPASGPHSIKPQHDAVKKLKAFRETYRKKEGEYLRQLAE